ncbi:hypothetical protein CBM2623_A80134 [Cupriavidus taiwanensis]|nr:hypothetical protein CBM2608_A70096 [Cupriavidus taiwanensis]SPA31625.1 hypothetical protein CBM2623_A80134 [Cupriavidus taiwanensis]
METLNGRSCLAGKPARRLPRPVRILPLGDSAAVQHRRSLLLPLGPRPGHHGPHRGLYRARGRPPQRA